MFWKNPLNYVGLAVTSLLELAMRVIFMLYGKKVRVLSKKIAAGNVPSRLSEQRARPRHLPDHTVVVVVAACSPIASVERLKTTPTHLNSASRLIARDKTVAPRLAFRDDQ